MNVLISMLFYLIMICNQKNKIVIADPILIQRFIHSVYGNVEKAKSLIEKSFNMRNNYAHIFLKRDPLSIESKQVFEVA